MRELNKQQKQLLNEWYLENGDKAGIFFDLAKCESFSWELLDKLIKLNDFEIITQEINRYIGDKVSESWRI